MKVRVYGAQPDELRLYEEAEKQGDLSFVFAKAPLNEETVQEVQDCEALILLTNCQVNEKVAEELSKRGVKYLACRSAGTDHVDYTAVKRLGMRCCNVPFYAPEAIAEHTILMALRVLRHEKKCSAKVAAGDYTLEGLKGRQLGQLTAGVLGTGRIGRTTMSLLNGFGARVLGWDPYPNEAAAKLCTYVERDELLKQSDIIFLHCPLTPDSYHVIGRETLGMMREGAVLINTARGGLVDQNAVLEALESGRLGGFAFDVYENEAAFVRKKKTLDEIDDPTFQALLARDDAIYSPHVAFYTDGAIYSMIEVTLANLREYLTTGRCRNEVKEEAGPV